jgi:hypothetical protein
MRRGILVVTVGVVLVSASLAQAATYDVTKRADHAPDGCSPADCTLREAMLAANATVGVADRVVLPSRKPYRLAVPGGLEDEGATGDFDVLNDRLLIVHPGKGRATVDGSRLDRVFDAYAPITLRKLVIRHGKALRYGGGIRVEAPLSVVDSVIRGNESASCGGGIHTRHRFPLRIIRSSVVGNESAQGGGVSNSCFGTGGQLTMIRSTIARNRGGIDSFGDFEAYGGGMYFQTHPDFRSTIKNSTFAGNSTGPAIDDADGGAIFANLGGLRVTGSTFSGNRAGDAGGALEVDGSAPLRLTNTTISGNRANGNGGGIDFMSGEASLNGVTVVRNAGNLDGTPPGIGGGILYGDGLSIENSLVALNRLGSPGGGSTRNDCAGEAGMGSAGHNLFSHRSLCEFDGPGDFVRRNPKLGKLGRHGGPTKTVALKKRSPAIGKAKRSSAPGKDQRGHRRDRRPDIGAYER